MVQREVAGHGLEPAAGGGARRQFVKALVRLQEHFLGDVLSLSSPTDQAKGGGEHQVLVVPHERLELEGITHPPACVRFGLPVNSTSILAFKTRPGRGKLQKSSNEPGPAGVLPPCERLEPAPAPPGGPTPPGPAGTGPADQWPASVLPAPPRMSATALQSLKALFAPTDEQLMWRVQTTGDSGAFGELVRRWEAPIQRLCARLTGDEHRAEDLAQEVFTRIFAHRAGFKHGAKFSTYLWRVALNHA